MRKKDAAAVAIGAVLVAAIAGSRHSPANVRDAVWYARLEKPSFRPPGAAIGAAWTVLDVLLAYAGTRLLSAPASPSQRVAPEKACSDVPEIMPRIMPCIHDQ